MIDAIAAALARDDDYWTRDAELFPLALVTQVVGPAGRLPAAAPEAVRAECDMAPELLRASPM
jgi:hypothetical protein